MAHASSIHGVALRATRLGEDGKPLVGETNSYVTSAYMKFGFTPEYTAGDEIEEKSANGNVCVYYQGEDVMKRVTFSLSLCNPDPDLTQMLAGGTLLLPTEGTEAIGYAAPLAGAEGTPNGVALEVWSHAIIAGRKAGTDKFWRWVFPFAKMKFTGERAMENGRMANEFEGYGLGNTDFGKGPKDDWNYSSASPFQFVRAATAPTDIEGYDEVTAGNP